MAKVAIFVEGETESELTIKLLTALCGKRGVAIEVHRQHCGRLQYIRSCGDGGASNIALVANCSNDGQVKTQIRDRYDSLVQAGYTRIIGIRDLYPFSRSDLPRVEAGKGMGLPVGPVPIDLHLAVMEVEAWFLDEVSHFERIHKGLTFKKLEEHGFNVLTEKGESWDQPAVTLNEIYKLEGLAWKKTGDQIRRTVGALCMESLYVKSRERSASLSSYLTSLEEALF